MVFNQNRFEVWKEHCQMQTAKTNDSHNQTFGSVTRVKCSQFLTKYIPIDMVLIPRSNRAIISSEFNLNS
jgi:hypothetical protein